MAKTLKEETADSLLWGGMNNVFLQVVGLVFGIILGRLLSRSDYGMIAMITIFSLVASELYNGGFKVALINLKAPEHKDFNSVFWFNILAGTGLYVVLFFCAPLIARYYHQPELTWLCRYAFLGLVFASFGVAQLAYMTKYLKIKQVSQCSMAAVLVSSIVGALMAWRGFGYWSLATQNLLYIVINLLLVWHCSPWRPTFDIDFGPVRRMFPFSMKIMLSGILTHINANVMNIMLGRHYSAQDTGDYNQAYQWSSKAYLLVQNMVKQVDLPVLSSIQDQRQQQLHVLRKMMRFTAFVSFPLLFGLALVSHEFIIITIGQKWATSATLLPLLCVSGAFMPLSTLMSDMIASRGRSDIFMWCTVTLGVLQIVLISTLWPYGIRTMVVAFVALNLAWVGVWFFFVARLTGYRLVDFLKDIMPFALVALAVMVATRLATAAISSLVVLLAVRVVLAAGLYYLVMRLARVKIMDDCLQFIRARLKRGR